MDFEMLRPELRERAIACKSPEELLELAKQEGIELSDDQLSAISGGSWNDCDSNTCNDYDDFYW